MAVTAALRASAPRGAAAVTPELVAEVLWLAPQLPAGPLGRGAPGRTGSAEPAGPWPEGVQQPATAGRAPAQGRSTGTGADLHPAGDGSSPGGIAGYEVGIPKAAALPEALRLGRALRPLRIRRPDRRRWQVDEVATATRAARLGLNPSTRPWGWTPVVAPLPARWPDLALVVDGAATMTAWREEIQELSSLLERVGAFRDLSLWQLTCGRGGSVQVAVAGRAGAPTEPAARRPLAAALPDPTGRRMVLVLTDGTDPAWGDGRYGMALASLALTNPVVVTSLVPEWLWPAGGLQTTAGQVLVDQPLLPNARWQVAQPATSAPPIPVADLTPWRLGRCVAAMAGSRQRWTNLRMLKPDGPAPLPRASVVDDGSGDPELAVARLRARFTPAAYELLLNLAAIPVELNFVRILMRMLTPSAGVTELAAVLYGQVLEPVAGPGRLYRFVDPRLRDVLRRAAGPRRRDSTQRQLCEYLVRRCGRVNETFGAVLADPDSQERLAAFESSHGPIVTTPRHAMVTTPRHTIREQPGGPVLYELRCPIGPIRRQQGRELVNQYGQAWPKSSPQLVTVSELTTMDEPASYLRHVFGAAENGALYVEDADHASRALSMRDSLRELLGRPAIGGPRLVIFGCSYRGVNQLIFAPSARLRREQIPVPSGPVARWYLLLTSRLGLHLSVGFEDRLWQRATELAPLLQAMERRYRSDALHQAAVVLADAIVAGWQARAGQRDRVRLLEAEDLPDDLGAFFGGGSL